MKITGVITEDPRPPEYCYWDLLMDHLGVERDILYGNYEATNIFFSDELVYPRQLELHLPGDHRSPCALNCPHCAGRYFKQDLGTWEMTALDLLNNLKGAIPYHIYGGAYTEPLMNPYFMALMHVTKKYSNHFGIHTSGHLLLKLEQQMGWLTELNRISTDKVDYLSISLDAGLPWSWAKTKGAKDDRIFNEIIEALRLAVQIRERTGKGHAIRICYLISPHSDSPGNFSAISNIARAIGVDSLRFSIPFASYNQPFDKVREYKRDRELVLTDVYKERLKPYLSSSMEERPYIFYTGPEFTDIDRFTFKKCVYCYFQITYGADGYVYKCSTTAAPTMDMCRLGKATSDLDEFNALVKKNANQDWDTDSCFSRGARCNRMGLEINTEYEELS